VPRTPTRTTSPLPFRDSRIVFLLMVVGLMVGIYRYDARLAPGGGELRSVTTPRLFGASRARPRLRLFTLGVLGEFELTEGLEARRVQFAGTPATTSLPADPIPVCGRTLARGPLH
jgi:hypothetical protein